MNGKLRWATGLGVLLVLVVFAVWRIVSGSPEYLFILRLYKDPVFLRETLQSWGWGAPAVFIAIQALQVIISPIPGEATGLLGGYLFGLSLGFIFSTIGLTIGTMACFWIGRWVGAGVVRRYVSDHVWERLGFIVEAEGAILCFVIYLIPGFPKDIVSYLFGISPMPGWIFALVSTLGRMPGTWVLSAQGAKTAAGHYIQVALLTAVVAAVGIPLYYSRHRILRLLSGTDEAENRTGNRT
jgi:uncharacterized membrane protein YdjX (TVP38/TMEM64 family)